jgi:hypothetical protein
MDQTSAGLDATRKKGEGVLNAMAEREVDRQWMKREVDQQWMKREVDRQWMKREEWRLGIGRCQWRYETRARTHTSIQSGVKVTTHHEKIYTFY